MKKHRTLLLILATLLLILAIFTGFFLRMVHHDQANRDLISAVKKGDTTGAIAALDAGAEANTHDHSDAAPPTFSEQIRRFTTHLFHPGAQPAPDARSTALLTLLDLHPEGTIENPDAPYPPDNPDLVRTLLDHGADVNAKDVQGETPLVKAAHYGLFSTLHLLAEKGGRGQFDQDMAALVLNEAIVQNNMDAVRILLDQNISVNARYDKMTLLMIAASRGNKAIVQMLLDKHADVNQTTREGATALSLAEKNGDHEIVQMLRKAGAKTAGELKAKPAH